MSPTKKLFGMFLAASPDISAGLILAHVWLRFVVSGDRTIGQTAAVYGLGVMCALLPDVSLLIYHFIKNKPLDYHHRDLTHFPLLILPPLFILGLWTHWTWLMGLCLAAHFADDVTDPGGLALFAPLSLQRFQIIAKEKQPLQLEEWLERYIFRWNFKLGLIIGMGAICLLVFFFV